MTDLSHGLPPLLASHLELVLVALVAACLIGLPLALAVVDRPRLAFALVAVAGVVQTIPGLALLALMVPIVAALGLSPFGFTPAVIALALYAVLPILRNAITGLAGVDPAVLEAARGMGLSRGQVLRDVQLPLAAPVIAAGVRTAAVWTVGTATLATPVGQACLGNYIFAGLQTRNWTMLLLGVVAAAALALALDGILGAAERALAARRARRRWLPAAALALLVALVIGILPRIPSTDDGAPVAVTPRASNAPAVRVRIGAKTFTEQYILAEVLGARLGRAGIAAELVQSLGSTVVFDALRNGDVDAYVDYTGTIWINLMKRAPGAPRWQILAEVEAWLAREHRIRSLGTLGFENAYALAMRRATAERLGVRTIADLREVSSSLAIGGDYEWFGRGEWGAVRAAYGLRFTATSTFDPTLLYEAVARDEVGVISAFSSDGRIAAHDLITLEDPANALPPYDALLLLHHKIADDPRVVCALAPLRDSITIARMREANLMVDRADDKRTPAQAAAWLLETMRDPPCL